MSKTKKPKIQAAIQALLLANPELTNKEINIKTGASLRTICYAREKLRKNGEISESRRTLNESENLPDENELEIDLLKLAESSDIEEEIGNDQQIRAKIVKSVQRMALNPKLHPDTRLSASQVWLKLKDIAKESSLGPGPPRTEAEIIDRLIRIFEAVGHVTVIKALELFTRKETSDETSTIEQTSVAEGASKDIN